MTEHQYRYPARPGTTKPRSTLLQWIATALVWMLAISLVIVLTIAAGRYVYRTWAPDGLPRGELVQTLGAHPFQSQASGHVKSLAWLEVLVLGFTGVVGEWNPIQAVAFRADNRRLVSVARSEMILWDLEDGSVVARVRTSDYRFGVPHLVFFAGGSRIALFPDYGSIQIFDGESLEPIGAIPGSDGHAIAARPDAAGDLWYALAADEELVVRRITVSGDEVLFRRAIAPYDSDGSVKAGARPNAVRLEPDERRLILLYEDGNQTHLSWDDRFALRETELSEAIDYFEGPVVEEEYFESTVAIVRSRSIAPRVDLARLEHIGSFTAAAVSADGRWIATGSEDMLVRIWKAPDRSK